MIVWPAELPQYFVADDMERPLPDGREITKVQAGPARARQLYSASEAVVPCTLPPIDIMQKRRLERFWAVDTKGGSLPFQVPDQFYDGLPNLDEWGAPILDGEGQPTIISAKWLVLFGKPAPAIRGFRRRTDLWTASFSLLIMP